MKGDREVIQQYACPDCGGSGKSKPAGNIDNHRGPTGNAGWAAYPVSCNRCGGWGQIKVTTKGR